MPASCLTFIWPMFCVLRLLTIYAVLYVADNVHRVLPLRRGKRKPWGSSATSVEAMPAISAKTAFVLIWISYIAHYPTICPWWKVGHKSHWRFLFSQAYPDMNIVCFLETTQRRFTLILEKVTISFTKKDGERKKSSYSELSSSSVNDVVHVTNFLHNFLTHN